MNRKIKFTVLVFITAASLAAIKVFTENKFSSVEDFQNYIDRFGATGPLILTFFQAVQVVIPVLPGYFGCAVGAVSFGTLTGFICNYVGISLGSVAAYFIARHYGIRVMNLMFSEDMYQKWRAKIEKKKSYELFLFLATLLPLFPDDFLCYFSGLIKMNAKRFIWIIILGKPWCILAYSIIFGMIK